VAKIEPKNLIEPGSG